MPLAQGDKIGPYEIVDLLGKGGMGEVYRAHDTNLSRDVAIKVLPAALAQDPDRLARFEREAKVLAAMNHPNIAIIHGLENTATSARAIVMELVEGPTLADRLEKGALPLKETLSIARQIADALEAAHDKGVVHRDLKPANVKVREDGTVKVLDFGLATAVLAGVREAGHGADSPTLTLGATQTGMILGTAAYMAPEQAEGKPVDRRADIWSFGVVLWEMLTGKRLFHADTVPLTLADVLRKELDFTQVPEGTPTPVRELVERCLDRDVKSRLQAIGEARVAIQRYLANPSPPVAERSAPLPTPSPSRLRWLWPGVAALLALVAAGLALVHFRATSPEVRMITTSILPPEGAAFDFVTTPTAPEISPDGRWLVFDAHSADGKTRLWLRPLNSRTAQPLAGTENPRFPFWSPDSKHTGFFASGKLKTVDAAGGPPRTLAEAPFGHGGSWSPEGVIVFSPNETGPLQRVPASGGAGSPATTLDAARDLSHKFPWFLPDGRRFVFANLSADSDELNLEVGSLDSKEVLTKISAPASSNAIYADGHLVFLRENTLMAQPFDAKRLATTGDAVPVAEQVAHTLADPVGLFSVASPGLLVYQTGAGTGSMRLTWFGRSGKPAGTLGDAGDFYHLEFSPDQKSLAASVNDSTGKRNLWIYDVARGLRTRFSFNPTIDDNPVWSPDGRSIAFRSRRKEHFDLYRKASDGTGTEELLYSDNLDKTPSGWSPDGKILLYTAVGSKTNDDIWALPLTPQQAGAAPKPFPFLQTVFRELHPRFSPDGRWVAYESDESQQLEIYVAPFPGPGGKRQISTDRGALPRWRRDGKEIFYVGADARLMAAEVNVIGSRIEVGQVRPLDIPTARRTFNLYDISTDGQRFLVAAVPEQASAVPLTLVENWTAGLKK